MAIPFMGIANEALGIWQTIKATKGLNELNRQQAPNFTVSPELQGAYSRAESMTGKGFAGAQEANFLQQLARQQNAQLMGARNMSGGNLSQALLGAFSSQNIGAINQFAADDAQQRLKNIQYADALAQSVQQQKNLATQTQIEDRRMKEQAYGAALQAGLKNIVEPINLNQALNYGGGAGLFGGFGQRTENPNLPQQNGGFMSGLFGSSTTNPDFTGSNIKTDPNSWYNKSVGDEFAGEDNISPVTGESYQ